MIPYKTVLEERWGEFFSYLNLNFVYLNTSRDIPAFGLGNNVFVQVIPTKADEDVAKMIAYGRQNRCLVATIVGEPWPGEYRIVVAGWWHNKPLASLDYKTMAFKPVLIGYSTLCEGVSFDIEVEPNKVQPIYISKRYDCTGLGCRHVVVGPGPILPTTPLHKAYLATREPIIETS